MKQFWMHAVDQMPPAGPPRDGHHGVSRPFAFLDKVISGGQSGADRAGLDWAIHTGITHGGWCPKGRLATDGPIDPQYNLKETSGTGYFQRTKRNIVEADATLIFTYEGGTQGGTLLTIKLVSRLHKPHHIVVIGSAPANVLAKGICVWMNNGRYGCINVAGPSARSITHVYEDVISILSAL